MNAPWVYTGEDVHILTVGVALIMYYDLFPSVPVWYLSGEDAL
jgi:hypothetical protein